MGLKSKSVLYTILLWIGVLGLAFLMQLMMAEAMLWSKSLTEQLNTFAFGFAIIILISFLQFSGKFPLMFDTKWYLFHIIICTFSYLIYNGIFVNMAITPTDGMMFVNKSSSFGNELVDKILGNGIGIYGVVVLIFSLVYRRYGMKEKVLEGGQEFAKDIKVKLANKTYFLSKNDILFIKSSNNYTDLHTQDGKHVIRVSITNLEKELDPTAFMRIHRSVIIKIDQVMEFISSGNGDYKVKLKNDDVFNIGNKYKPNVMARFGL